METIKNIYRKVKLQPILFIYNIYIKYTTYKNIYRKGNYKITTYIIYI
jgi:hypothetical protein